MEQGLVIQTSDGRREFFISDDFCSASSISEKNYNTSKCFILSWIALLSDSPLNSCGSTKPVRLYRDFLSYIRSNSLKSTIIEFSSLAHKFAAMHTLTGAGSSIGDWIDEFKDTPVFFEYNRYYQTGDVELFDFIYNFLVFGKKIGYVDESLEETAFRGWIDIEKRLADQIIPGDDLAALKAVLSVALPTFTMQHFRPKFGPGAVSERGVHGRIQKVESFMYDRMIDRFMFGGHLGYYGAGHELGLSGEASVPTETWSRTDKRVSSRIARLMFVPKDIKTSRSICMEPNVLQYFQQGVLSSMLDLLGESGFSSFIKLEDQSRNRFLAEVGSFSASIDTIDLSSASDCLSLNLVKAVFPKSWQIPMLVTRSHGCFTPDGSVHELKKFAPMGSALCFPTQCMVFCAVVVYAGCAYAYVKSQPKQSFSEWLTPSRIRSVISSFGKSDGFDRKPGFTSLAVYGDDICLDSRLTGFVMLTLDRLGFLVNRQKSFVGSQLFRESCGGYYLNGFDVTPLFFRGSSAHNRAQDLASKTALCNQAWEKGYRGLYRYTLRSILYGDYAHRSNGVTSIFFKDQFSDSFGVIAKSPHNKHLRARENSDLQRTEYNAISITHEFNIPDKRGSVDRYEYMRWMSNHLHDNSTDFPKPVSRSDTGGARIVRRWIPNY
uniref:RNA-directed RNA polymerase n=1 Tax=Leviviridae sp. TaxID=2027243 RepID=A0A514DA62_9VIRU|nr:MAG: RNA-dependent RNA polymerase [Leviviridae sp.]